MAADVSVSTVVMDPAALVLFHQLVEEEASGYWSGQRDGHMAWKRVVLYLHRLAKNETALTGETGPRVETAVLLMRIVDLTRERDQLAQQLADLEASDDEAGASVDGIRTVATAGELL